MSFYPQISQGTKLNICVFIMLEKNKQYGIPYKVFWDKVNTWKVFNTFQSGKWFFCCFSTLYHVKTLSLLCTGFKMHEETTEISHLPHVKLLILPTFNKIFSSISFQGWENCNKLFFFLFPLLNIIRMAKNV